MSKKSSNFTGREFANKAAEFSMPIGLPSDEAERVQWQAANKSWWETTPMRYDWRDEIPFDVGTREYYEEIDRRFIASSRDYLPWKTRPFDPLIPYADLANFDVLEIGVGQGTHAQLITPHCRSFTGIDLTEAATTATAKRFTVFGLAGNILQMDAEAMGFDDASFDYIWSWGVIHHSADTRRVLVEMNRVLRPGGRATVMVYHRNWWNFYVVAGLMRGIVQRQLRYHGSLHALAQGATDGALARYYRPEEWRKVTNGLFTLQRIRICGLKNDVIPLPAGRLKTSIERNAPSAVTRAMTNTLRMGSFLVADMEKA